MIVLRRSDDEQDDGQQPIGTWRAPGPRNALPWLIAIVRCPRCGTSSSLSARVHQVAADGTVTPSYVCPHAPCSFHDFVTLHGWAPPKSAA